MAEPSLSAFDMSLSNADPKILGFDGSVKVVQKRQDRSVRERQGHAQREIQGAWLTVRKTKSARDAKCL